MKKSELRKIIREEIRRLREASPGEEAKKRGLKHIGFGRYVVPSDPSRVVAVSRQGKLMRLKKPAKEFSTFQDDPGDVRSPYDPKDYMDWGDYDPKKIAAADTAEKEKIAKATKKAHKEAMKRGLNRSTEGPGRYTDDSGNVVAVIRKGKLMRLKKPAREFSTFQDEPGDIDSPYNPEDYMDWGD